MPMGHFFPDEFVRTFDAVSSARYWLGAEGFEVAETPTKPGRYSITRQGHPHNTVGWLLPVTGARVVLRWDPAELHRRRSALAQHLGCDVEDVTDDGESRYFAEGQEFSVRTDDEATDAAKADIERSLWAFNLDVILQYTPLAEQAGNAKMCKALAEVNSTLCEDANPLWAALVGNRLRQLQDHTIAADGRGHCLSSYDGKEYEVQLPTGERYYITRDN